MQQPLAKIAILKTNYNESPMVNDIAIKYQNILLDSPDESINNTFSTPSPVNSLVTKRKTSFAAKDPHIKNMISAFHYLKRQILREVTQEIKKCKISKCNTSSTPYIISSLNLIYKHLRVKLIS